MYHLRRFKVVDLLIQILITAGLLLYGHREADMGGAFFFWLFAMGGWQIISCLVHIALVDKDNRAESRRAYELTLAISLLAGWMLLYLFLFIGPAMALWYFLTCLFETIRFAQRPKPTYS